MKYVRGITYFILIFSLTVLLLSCSDGSTGPGNDENNTYEALEGYWGANQSINEAFAAREQIIAQMEDVLLPEENLRNRDSFDEMMQLLDDLDDQSEIVADRFDDLIDLENDITAYGENGRNMFTDGAKAIVVGTFRAVKNTVVNSAKMARTTFRVCTGQQSLREALSDPDSGIPLVSGWAANVREHLALTDQSIRDEILLGDDHEGLIDINSIPGNTLEEKANNYLNMSDDDPIKKYNRRNIHIWDRGNATRIHTNVTKNAKEGTKHLVGTITSEAQVEIMEEMTNQEQDPTPGTVVQETVDTTTQESVEETKTVIIAKRNQPENDPKIVIIDEATDEIELDLPGGVYDFIVIAEDYVRTLRDEMEVAANDLIDETLEMYKYSEFSILIENMQVTTFAPVVNQPIDITSTVISLLGIGLDFDWTITGGTYSNLDNDNNNCSFVPEQPNVYTITLTVTDEMGATKSHSVEVTVTDIDIRVADFEIVGETFYDNKYNPGESVQIKFYVENLAEDALVGDIFLEGTPGINVPDNGLNNVTIPAAGGGYYEYTATVNIPIDYSDESAQVALNFNTSYETKVDVNIACPVILDVEFYVYLDPLTSPVIDRIVTVSGSVANPSLGNAMLVLDGDYDNIFEVNLYYGNFSRQIALSGSSDEEDHSIELIAQSGSLLESTTIDFTAEIPPQGFRVTLTWDTGGTDVDLWTTGPNGIKCYYANPTTGDGLILDFDDTDGYGPENISCEIPPEGDYLVQVHYFSDHDSENAISTSCSVVIRLNEGTPDEEVYNYYGYLGDTGDVWTVTTITLGYDGLFQAADIDEHSITESDTLPQK